MSKGGSRNNAGAKSTWLHGKTKTIRVPIDLADRLMEIARELDEGKAIETEKTPSNKPDTESEKVINLAGVRLRQHEGVLVIRLEDLAKAGYKILPQQISEMVKARLQKIYGHN